MPTPFEIQAMQYAAQSQRSGMPPPMASPDMNPTAAGAALRNAPTQAQKQAAAAAGAQKPPQPPIATPPIDPETQAQSAVTSAFQAYQDAEKRVSSDDTPIEKMPSYTAPTYQPPDPKTILGLAIAAALSRWGAPALAQTAGQETTEAKETYARNTQQAQDAYKAAADKVTEDNSAATNRFGKEVTQADAAGRLYQSTLANQTNLRRALAVEQNNALRRNDTLKHWADSAAWQRDKFSQTLAQQTAMLARRDDDAMARAQVSLPLRIAALKARVDIATLQNQTRIGLAGINNVALNQRAKYRQEYNELGKAAAAIVARQKADSAIIGSLFGAAHPDDPKVQAAQTDLTVTAPADTAKLAAQFKGLGADLSDNDALFQKLQDDSQAEVDALNNDPSYAGGLTGLGAPGGVSIQQTFVNGAPQSTGSTTGSTTPPADPAQPAAVPPAPKPIPKPVPDSHGHGPLFFGRPLAYYRSVVQSAPDKNKAFTSLPIEIQHALGHV